MLVDLMNAHWDLKIRVFMKGTRWMAIILVTILATAWIRIMGLKSDIDSALSFFGIKTIFTELSQWKFSE
jgi:hypothetical protein